MFHLNGIQQSSIAQELTSTADYNLAETWITSPTGEESNIIDYESPETYKDSVQPLERE